jgi:hypothetical protein
MADPGSSRRAVLSPRVLLADAARGLGEDPALAKLALVYALAQLSVVGWDQPNALGWENDGVAPRDFLRGVADNLAWGHAHRYPLFHNLVLLVLCAPVLLAFALGGRWSLAAASERVLSVACMTAVSLVIKLVHVAMGCGLLLLTARLARRLFGITAGRWAALCVLTCVTITYYGRVSNLDGPYMFWVALTLDRVLSVLERGRARDYALSGVFAAASVATKDQAYAAYVLALPLYLVAAPLLVPRVVAAGSAHWRRLALASAWGVLGYGVLGGVLVNPVGFLARVRMLLGTNSQDWRNYARSAQGVLLNLSDLWAAQPAFYWHPGIVAACWLGVVLAVVLPAPPGGASRLERALPIVAGLSSVLAFTLPVARCEHRFVLPLGVALCVYGGAALAWLGRRTLTLPLALLACLAFALSARQCLALALTQWSDPRREVEHYLARLPRGSAVEIYGFTVLQPRLDASPTAPYRVQRVGKESPSQRARIPGVREVQARFGDVVARRPDAVVITQGFIEQFLAREFRPGESPSAQWLAAQRDEDAVRYFRAAVRDAVPGYRTSLTARVQLPDWARALGCQPVRIHDTTAGTVWVLVPAS